MQFHGNDGVLVVDRGGWEIHPETDRIDKPMRVYKMAGMPRYDIRPDRENMHLEHVKNFLDCVRSREKPRSDVEVGHNSMIACHLGNMAFRLGRRVDWDVEREKILNDPAAEKFVFYEYRKPWKLEV